MTIFGPDISKWQDGIAPANLGFKFLIARASIARTVDYMFDSFVTFARDRKYPFAGYHFPYPRSHTSAADQAATWDKACKGDKRIACMIDWESDGSQAATADDAVAIAQAIEAKGYKVTLLYTGTWYWQQQGSPSLTRLNELGIGLVIANYGPNHGGEAADVYAGRGGDGSSVWTTKVGGVTPTFWQFGSLVHIGTRNGQPLQGDCNAYRGSAADLGRWFTTWGSDPPTPIPPDPPDPFVPLPPVNATTGVSIDMAALASKQTDSDTFWYSPDGGGHRLPVRDLAHAANVIKTFGSLIDSKTGNKTTTWDQVAKQSLSEVQRLLGPEAK